MYKSANIVLSVIQKEYEYERDRKGKLESKASILFTLLIAIQTFLISKISIPKEIDFDKTSILIIYILLILMIIAILFLFIAAVYNLIKVIMLSKYKQLDVETFNRDLCTYPEDTVNLAIFEKYQEVLIHNRNLNDEKSVNFQNAIMLVVWLFLITMITYLILWCI